MDSRQPLKAPLQAVSPESVKSYAQALERLQANMNSVILGKQEVVEKVLITLLSGGHLLIEDVPGVGKTTLALALAQSISGKHQRIQFTSDLLPSDVLGVPIFSQQKDAFQFKEGPIFANIVLADEINRTTPKTQSCLLEAMQDGRVTIEKEAHTLPRPFMVIATQNPIEFHGTYPLPESQLDRFLMRIHMGYPNRKYERDILQNKSKADLRTPPNLKPVLDQQTLLHIQKTVGEVHLDESLIQYLLDLADETRNNENIELGISPRGLLALHRAAQARAILQGREYCIPDDIKELAQPCLSHRIVPKATFQPNLGGPNRRTTDILLEEILSRIQIPQ